MAVSTPSQNALLPLPAHIPTKTRCIELDIPDDPDFFKLFYGALDALSNWYAYDRDTAKTGRLVARLWFKAIMSIRDCETQAPIFCCESGCCEDCMQFRQQGCLLQAFDCLTQEWVTVYDGSQCTPNPAPGAGANQPVGGQSAQTCLTAQANAQTPLPWAVSTGDTLDFTSLTGASKDSSLQWYCPDGSYYVLGGCGGGGAPSGSDPLPTTNHQALIMLIGSTYYPVVPGIFTVPSGVANKQVYIQVNDPSLGTCAGQLSICVTYQNNAAPPTTSWCYKLDLTTSPRDFISFTVDDGCADPVNNGVWSSSNGWQIPTYIPGCVGHSQAQGTLSLDMGIVTNITSVEIKGHYFGNASGARAINVRVLNSPPWSGGGSLPVNYGGFGANTDFDLTGTTGGTLARYIQLGCSDITPGLSSGPVFVFTELVLQGTGTSPFGPSNC